ncbi:MAG: glycosyltransferase family 4 protein [Candidatus Woesearchaeota archaeon]
MTTKNQKGKKEEKDKTKEQDNKEKRKKRLLVATDSYLPRWDGVARFLSEIIPEIDDDFDITLVAPSFPGKYSQNNKIKEVRFPLQKLRIGDYTPPKASRKKIEKLVKESDLVWSHTIGPIGSSAINSAKKLKKKTVAYIHSIEWELVSNSINKPLLRDPVSMIVKEYSKNLYNKCSLLMVPSRKTGDILQWKKITTHKIVVRLGVNTSKFLPPLNKDAAKMNLNISPKMKVIGFTGRVAYEKNLKTLARAFIRLKDEYENIILLIVGDGVPELKEKFSKIEGVKMVGSKDNIVQYLQAMDIYVLPSLTETTSLSTLEAMSCEIPVVATPVGDVAFYLVNNVNGFKFSKENSFDLVVKLRKLLDNPELRKRIGTAARSTVVENFS